MDIKHIFIIGAGTMGNGIAQVAATSGYTVTCMDVFPAALEKAKAGIAKSTAKLLEKGVITAEQKANADKIQFVGDMSTMKDADLVIEAATENPELKFKIFKDMDANAREGVILATNTSSISITKIAAATKRPDKVIGMHFMNPVPLMKLVEIIRGLATTRRNHQDRGGHLQGDGQGTGRGQRLARLHLQPHPVSDDQRSHLRLAGRCRHARSD